MAHFVFQFIYRYRGLGLQAYYAEDCIVGAHQFVLIGPFQQGEFLACHDAIGNCRVPVRETLILPRFSYNRRRIARQAWMDVDIADLSLVRGLLIECKIEVVEGGARRGF